MPWTVRESEYGFRGEKRHKSFTPHKLHIIPEVSVLKYDHSALQYKCFVLKYKSYALQCDCSVLKHEGYVLKYDNSAFKYEFSVFKYQELRIQTREYRNYIFKYENSEEDNKNRAAQIRIKRESMKLMAGTHFGLAEYRVKKFFLSKTLKECLRRAAYHAAPQ
jgi:hypothetical protein